MVGLTGFRLGLVFASGTAHLQWCAIFIEILIFAADIPSIF